MQSGSYFSLLLLNSIANALQPGIPEKNEWLMMTQILMRHVDRAAEQDTYITPAANEVFYRGYGELSDEGLAHAKRIGQDFRTAYVNTTFLDGRFSPREISFQSIATNRVLMTASAFSAGLFQTDDGQAVAAPIYTAPGELLDTNFDCTQGWDDMVAKYNLTDTINMPIQINDQMRARDWDCAEPPAAQSDTLLSEFANSRTKPQLTTAQQSCASDNARRFMYDYIESLGGTGPNYLQSRDRMIRTVGALATMIMDNFIEMDNCYQYGTEFKDPNAGKALVFVAHDVNLIALMNVISNQQGARSFFQDKSVSFGASLTLELWVMNNVPIVKAYVKDGFDKPFTVFDYCQFLPEGPEYPREGGYCTLEAINKAKNDMITSTTFVC